jgi:hypothetical protein
MKFEAAQRMYDMAEHESFEHISYYYSEDEVPEEFKKLSCSCCKSDEVTEFLCIECGCIDIDTEIDWAAFEKHLKECATDR